MPRSGILNHMATLYLVFKETSILFSTVAVPTDMGGSFSCVFLLMRVKESKKAGLKLKIQKTKIMASGPITSWQIDGEKLKTVADFIFLGSKITVDSDCSHKMKRCLLLGRKAMTNLDSALKSRDITSLQSSV